ncbi:MAG: hypothetical protein KIT31_18810, partial [Deltaproteobacteria bacterium]|nr:hypothetical protein [Deltaproteobacteria bacterium]
MTPLVSERLQFTHDGRWLARVDETGAALIALDGTRRPIAGPGAWGAAAFGDQLWTVGAAGLERWALDGRLLGEAIEVGDGALVPALAGGPAAMCASRMWIDDLGTFRELPVGDDATFPFAGRRQITASHHEVRLGAVRWSLPVGAKLVAAAALADGASVALFVRRGAVLEAWTSTAAGSVQHRITLPAGELRLAARRGLLIVHTSARRIGVIDLRFGRS